MDLLLSGKGLMKTPSLKLRPRQCPDHRFSEGFTFVEVLIVAVILGIVAGLSLPTLTSSLNETRLSAAGSEVVTALEFAQLTAVTTGRPTRVTMDAVGDTILVEQLTFSQDILTGGAILAEAVVENGSYTPMEYPLKRGTDYIVSLANESRFDGVDMTVSAFGADNWVIFNTRGTPLSGGGVTLACGSRQVQVALDPLTGKVTLID
jgi:prepilin-type N-terminal cleavage/methylation domain-containing protein